MRPVTYVMRPVTYVEIALVPALTAALVRWWVLARRRARARWRDWAEQKRAGDRAMLEAWRDAGGRPRLP